MQHLIVILCASLGFGLNTFSQAHVLKLEHFLNREIIKSVASTDSLVPTGTQPFLSSTFDLSKVYGHQKDSMRHYYLLSRKTLSDHLIKINEGEFKVNIDPIFDWSAAYDFRDNPAFQDTVLTRTNTRGFRLEGSIGDKLSFQSLFQENQSFQPGYLVQYIDSFGVMPGDGRVKAFKGVGYDYAFVNGFYNLFGYFCCVSSLYSFYPKPTVF